MLSQKGLDLLFLKAQTHSVWLNTPIKKGLLKKIYDLTKMGPTSANCCPLKIVFVISKKAKTKLKKCLHEGNIEKTMSAPATVIFSVDEAFYEKLPVLFPQINAKSWFVGNDQLIKTTAFRNATLQAGYFILAARAMGLDCGPMSGFDNNKLDELFFKKTTYKSNFLCNLGYGNPEKLYLRNPRLSFEEVCSIL